MGSNTIIAIVVGAVLVIVGFSLWPVLNGASNSLYSYFRDSCDDGSGNRFMQAYKGVTGALPATPDAKSYYVDHNLHGGSGVRLANDSGNCKATDAAFTANADAYSEQGELIGSASAPQAASPPSRRTGGSR